jgi:hypothetical protein
VDTANTKDRLHTLGLAAGKIGVQVHHLLRLCNRGLIPHQKIGRLHVVSECDFKSIREVCLNRGYLRSEVTA